MTGEVVKEDSSSLNREMTEEKEGEEIEKGEEEIEKEEEEIEKEEEEIEKEGRIDKTTIMKSN